MTTLAEAYAAEGLALPKPKQAKPEHALQTKLVGLAREFIAVEHEFAAHDRTKKHYPRQHINEAERGLRKGWPDTEIDLMGGITWRCEIKAAGERVERGSEQERLIARLNYLLHRTDWANSAQMWLEKARARGIVFRPGVGLRAAAIDEFLAEAERQRALGKPKPARSSKPRKEPANQGALKRLRQGGFLV